MCRVLFGAPYLIINSQFPIPYSLFPIAKFN